MRKPIKGLKPVEHSKCSGNVGRCVAVKSPVPFLYLSPLDGERAALFSPMSLEPRWWRFTKVIELS